MYQVLYREMPTQIDFFQKIILCHQQLEQYDKAEVLLKEKLENPNVSPLYYIELGYNFQLQEQTDEAAKYYDKAIGKLQDIPTYAYLIGYTFQQKSLLDYAVRSYKEGLELAPSQNLHLNLARVYGEMG